MSSRWPTEWLRVRAGPKRRAQQAVFCVVFVAICLTANNLWGSTVIELRDAGRGQFQAAGFELLESVSLGVDAVGLKAKYGGDLLAYAWIIDGTTRQPVWEMKEHDCNTVKGNRLLRKVSTELLLPKGRYEAYYYRASPWNFGNLTFRGTGDFFDFLGNLLGGDRFLDEASDECYLKISVPDSDRGLVRTFKVDGSLAGALIQFNRLGDSEHVSRGFTLQEPITLRVYALIECPGNASPPVDFGWIVDARTWRKVWQVTRENSRWAGGGDKNRYVDTQVSLPAGDYVLHYVTDDSHSFPEFNVRPPFDPFNWGITILPGTNFKPTSFREYDPPGRGVPLISFRCVGNDAFLQQPFKLIRRAVLHIYSLGEYSHSSNEFVDYGWIQDAASGTVAWQMTYGNTEYAGGARKNRMFDDTVTLTAGDYILYYMTDDSHSCGDWNDSPPFDPKAWGIAVYPGPGLKEGDFVKVTRQAGKSTSDILVRMVAVRDNEYRQDRFTLERQARIHIYAIGEGEPSGMVDYGWIVDKRTGRAVWEMTWRNTEPAGGARKNRLFDDDIVLDPGTYEVHYVTDGSHAFGSWNAPRPRDPHNWGITVSLAK